MHSSDSESDTGSRPSKKVKIDFDQIMVNPKSVLACLAPSISEDAIARKILIHLGTANLLKFYFILEVLFWVFASWIK